MCEDNPASDVSYSRMISLNSESDAMEHVHDDLLLLAIDEGHISEENFAIDAKWGIKKNSDGSNQNENQATIFTSSLNQSYLNFKMLEKYQGTTLHFFETPIMKLTQTYEFLTIYGII